MLAFIASLFVAIVNILLRTLKEPFLTVHYLAILNCLIAPIGFYINFDTIFYYYFYKYRSF